MTKFGNPTSVTNLLKQESERRLAATLAEARDVKVERADAIAELGKMCRSKAWWIQNFGSGPKKRAQHDIDTARRQLAVLVQLEDFLRGKEAANAGHPRG